MEITAQDMRVSILSVQWVTDIPHFTVF